MQRITDFSDYKFRCHALGKLMTGVKVGLTEKQEELFLAYDARYKGEGRPLTDKQQQDYFDLGAKRKAKPELSATTKTYLQELHRAAFLGRTNHITAKYLDKGLMVEAQSITLLSEVEGKPFFKNKETKANEWITGTPDNAFKIIRDIKSSWSLDSFPIYENKIPNQDYVWQLQGYMTLFGIKQAELIYCLVDTPFNLIEDELRRMDWKHNIYDHSGEVRKQCIDLVVETVSNHIFSYEALRNFCHQSSVVQLDWFADFTEIPADLRVKKFQVNHDPKMIEALYAQIKNARAYMNSLSESVADQLKISA